MNLYTKVPCYADEEKNYFNVVIEITKGSSNKVEYHEEEGYFSLDRVLFQSTFYPFDYGFIPQTKAGDGDAIDVCLLTTHPLFPGCVVPARAIGLLETHDQDGEDYKLLAVPITKVDPRFAEVDSIEDLPGHVKEEYRIYFKEYKKLETHKYDQIEIGDWKNAIYANHHIKEAHEIYTNKGEE